MSLNGWEAGTIKLPSADAARIRKQTWAAWNSYRERVFAAAKLVVRERRPIDTFSAPDVDSDDVRWLVESLKGRRLPKLADLDRHFGPRATSKTRTVGVGDWTISFDGRELHWRVGENNHAVERAHEHPVVKTLFRLLSQVHWTRGSGGEFVGNDEYNRDSDYAGGGANYVTMRFGKAAR